MNALAVPVLIIAADKDDCCLEPTIPMKCAIPVAGLAAPPRSGNAVNLEKSDAFNRALREFLYAVETGRCDRRDPRSLAGGSIGPRQSDRRVALSAMPRSTTCPASARVPH